MLRSLKSLRHSKIHNVGDESELLVVILQGMAVDIGEDAVLFQSRNSVFNPDPDPSPLCIEDFLRSSEFRTAPATFERNRNRKVWIIFLDALISVVNEKLRIFWDDLRQSRLLEEFVIVHSSADCRRYMKNQSVSFGRNLGF